MYLTYWVGQHLFQHPYFWGLRVLPPWGSPKLSLHFKLCLLLSVLVTSLTELVGLELGLQNKWCWQLPVSVRASSRDGPFFEDPTVEARINLWNFVATTTTKVRPPGRLIPSEKDFQAGSEPHIPARRREGIAWCSEIPWITDLSAWDSGYIA